MKKQNTNCHNYELPDPNPYTKELQQVVGELLKSCVEAEITTHVDGAVIPDLRAIIEVLEKIQDLLFPGFFGNQQLHEDMLEYHLGNEISEIFDELSTQIIKSLRYECKKEKEVCRDCIVDGQRITLDFLKMLPEIRRLLALDVQAAYAGDPAAKSYSEIVFSYPGLKAITLHRIAHPLYQMGVPLIPRIINEYAHKETGIDIHPGARIDESFFIDHGTGVVIGETTDIGKHVKIYQGVTLGALSFPKDEKGNLIREQKRHPSIEDYVTIYSGATILGGETVIGKGSVIGGNVFLISSVAPDTRVVNKKPEMNHEFSFIKKSSQS